MKNLKLQSKSNLAKFKGINHLNQRWKKRRNKFYLHPLHLRHLLHRVHRVHRVRVQNKKWTGTSSFKRWLVIIREIPSIKCEIKWTSFNQEWTVYLVKTDLVWEWVCEKKSKICDGSSRCVEGDPISTSTSIIIDCQIL